MTVEVFLASALICFNGVCHNALVGKEGKDTPIGTYKAVVSPTKDEGYGGSVLPFLKKNGKIYAIHRVWNLIPSEKKRVADKTE